MTKNILVIPTTDWIRHPVPNRLNFIFDEIAKTDNVYVLHFDFHTMFPKSPPRDTRCNLIGMDESQFKSLIPYYMFNNYKIKDTIEESIKKYNIDAIVSANILPSYYANDLGVPVIVDYLDHFEESAKVYCRPGIDAIVQQVVRKITIYNLNHANSIITVTPELKDYLKTIVDKPTYVIPNGVDTSLIYPMDNRMKLKEGMNLQDKIVLGYIGSIEPWVDLEMIMDVLPMFPNLCLYIVGPGLHTNYGERLKEKREQIYNKNPNSSNWIIFHDAVPYNELNRYINVMDIGLNPLRPMLKNNYSAGGKVFNYLACGLPVISSNVISLKRMMVEGIEYYDSKAELIGKLAYLTKSYTPCIYRNQQTAKKYDWKNLAQSYKEVIEQTINR